MMPANGREGRSKDRTDRQCHRKYTAEKALRLSPVRVKRRGKSPPRFRRRIGMANLIRSKIKQ